MPTAEAVISLSENLKRYANLARRKGEWQTATDLRLARLYLRKLACLLVQEELRREDDTARRRQLQSEVAQLWHGGDHAVD
jgi:hypothetical protein